MSKVNGILLVVSAVVVGILWYIFLPAINLRSPGFLLMIVIIGILLTVSLVDYECEEFTIPSKITGVITGIVLLVIIIGFITTWRVFHVEQYREIVTVTQENSFERDFPKVENDGKNIAYVDLNTARKLGDRAIGNIKHASWYDVNQEYNLIEYKGEYYRISPLEYAGLMKWHRAKYEGIPGYVLVNAKTQATQFVEVDGGYFYSPSAKWGKDLTRHLRSQYPNYMFGNSYFEIDDEGHPYWITGINQPTIGLFGGHKETSFIVTDAVNGKSQVYSIEDLPNWIDHAFGLDYLMKNIHNYYDLVNGVFNFSKTDVYRTSYDYRSSSDEDGEPFAGYNSFIDVNGDICFYVGLTPANKAESNTGFLTVNTRTGEVKEYRYDMSGGIEEGTAIERAESEVQNYKYVSTFPMLLNIADEPTYLMILKGNDGLIKQYALAMVSTESSVIITDNSLDGAILKYKEALNNAGVIEEEVETEPETEAKEVTGKITEKYEITVDGTTHYLYQINGKTTIYDASIKTGYMQATYVVGDKVTIKYIESEDDVLVVTEIATTK